MRRHEEKEDEKCELRRSMKEQVKKKKKGEMN